MKEADSPSARPNVEAHSAPPAELRLSAWDRLVCVPLGFIWLTILLIVAIPVCLYMTILYFAVRAVRRLAGMRSGS